MVSGGTLRALGLAMLTGTTRMFLPVWLVAAACAGAGAPGPHGALDSSLRECGPSGDLARDEAVYAALTEDIWYVDGGTVCAGPGAECVEHAGTSHRVQLDADGELSWLAFSDYPERSDRGTWSFHARSETGGHLCMRIDDDGTPDVLRHDFQLVDGNLVLDGLYLNHDPVSFDY